MRDLGPIFQMGWTLALTILLPLALGLWLDRRLSTTPLFVMIGALVGIIASSVAAVRMTTTNIEALSEKRSTKKHETDDGTDGDVDRKEDQA